MTEPDSTPTPQNPLFPAGWKGGVFEGHEAHSLSDWWDEDTYAPTEVWHLHADWGALEALQQGDPPGPWGFDLSSIGAGAGAVPRQTEIVSGVVARMSATRTGLLLEELPDAWLNVSRFHPDVDLAGIGVGDVVVVECELGRDRRRYVTRVLLAQPEVGR